MHQYNPNRKTQKCGKVLKNFFFYLGHFPIALGWWSSSGGGSRRWWSAAAATSGGPAAVEAARSGGPVTSRSGSACRCGPGGARGPTVAPSTASCVPTRAVAVAGVQGRGIGRSSKMPRCGGDGGGRGRPWAARGGPVIYLADRRWGGPATDRRGGPVTSRSAGGGVVRRPAGQVVVFFLGSCCFWLPFVSVCWVLDIHPP
ncbi:hypothetical protein Q3G72_018541 [Acer saccharum]|nr:hypothetical protein Q3G72_018541 [Acer saccharum]